MSWNTYREKDNWTFEVFDDYSSVRMSNGNTWIAIVDDSKLVANNRENPISPAPLDLVQDLIHDWRVINTFIVERQSFGSNRWVISDITESRSEADKKAAARNVENYFNNWDYKYRVRRAELNSDDVSW